MRGAWGVFGLASALLSLGCSVAIGGAGLISRGFPQRRNIVTPVEPFQESLAGLSFDPGALQFQCVTFRKASAAQVNTETRRWSSAWKITTLVTGGAEVIGMGLPLAIVDGTGRQIPAAGRATLDIFLVDGLLLMASAAVPARVEVTGHTEEAPLEQLNYCPQNIALRVGGNDYPIDSRGYASPAGATALLATMYDPSQSFQVVTPERTIDIAPTPEERCQWALSRGAPDSGSLCSPGMMARFGVQAAFGVSGRVSVGPAPLKVIIRFDAGAR